MNTIKRPWIPKDDAFLRANYKFMPHVAISKALDRTIAAIHTRGVVLGLARRCKEVAAAKSKPEARAPKPFTYNATPCSERELGWNP